MRSKTKTVNMTQGSPMKLIFFFALPLMFGNVFQQLYTVVDTAIVGRGVGMNALAALGTIDWFVWMQFSIAQGFTQGISILVSQKFGEGDTASLKRITGHGARVTLILGAVLTAVFVLAVRPALSILNVPEELRPIASVYTYILFGGFLLALFYNFCSSVLRAVGDSRTPLIAMIISSLTNLSLDAVAVFVLKWGVAGAASMTVFSQLVAGLYCAVKMWRIPELRFSKQEFTGTDSKMTKELFRLSTPVCFMNLVISIGGILLQSVVNTFGVTFIAGFTATNKLYGLLEIAAVSYGYAITTYVGQNYGAKQVGRIKQGVRSGFLLSVVTSALIASLMLIFGRAITGLFISTEDPAALQAAKDIAYQFLSVMSIFLPVLYLLYVYRSALQGMGDTFFAMISGIVEFVCRVGIAMYVKHTHFEKGLYFAEVGAWAGAMIFLCAVYYIRRKKLFRMLETDSH